MPRDGVRAQGRVVVVVDLGPVECDDKGGTYADDEAIHAGHPRRWSSSEITYLAYWAHVWLAESVHTERP